MKLIQVIGTISLMCLAIFTYGQDKLGFAIKKISMMGIEAKATGTVTFNKSFTEMEIKQHILPSDGKPEKNPKYETTRFKLDGMRMDGDGIKEFEGLDIVFIGAAISKGNQNVNITIVLDKDVCSLEIPAYGYTAMGMIISEQVNPINVK